MRFSFLQNRLFFILFVRHFKKINGILLLLGFCLFLLITYVIFADREAIYSVNAETEVATITLIDDPLNQWQLPSGTLTQDLMAFDQAQQQWTGAEIIFRANADTSASFMIDIAANQLAIVLQSETASVGTIIGTGRSKALGSDVLIKVPLASNVIFPFFGELGVGEDVTTGVRTTLLSGSINIIEKELFSDVRYVAGDYQMNAGDRVLLYKNHEANELVKLRGYIRLADKVLKVSANGIAELARVERLGSEGYSVTSSVWRRVINDPVLMSITTLLAILLLLMEIIKHIIELIPLLRAKNQDVKEHLNDEEI
ncbi:hypothetical protein [Pseudidiomarina insulisalsae]|uniref:Uncharacterized protein n=1 Tax=Pseudidiomarina insulisalsae TaxID=575789 RepID=A0A432YLE1_9GAMM|nr:hypothetical protein [Pseudidiomarina insulisalsae]RUO61797.1 hypothetical protein CWI71_05400 [Pseudidiomarina insulisalsae]